MSAVCLLACGGCGAHLCQLPDDFACAFAHTQLGWELHDVCHNCPLENCISDDCCGCDVLVSEDAVYLNEGCTSCSETACRRPRIAVGPPPERYEPPLPPEFLPVPARSVFTPCEY